MFILLDGWAFLKMLSEKGEQIEIDFSHIGFKSVIGFNNFFDCDFINNY